MPAPPYSTGKMVPSSPSLPSSLTVSSGNSPGSSHFMTLGAISRSANSRTIFFSCSCSSESWKSKPFLRELEKRHRLRKWPPLVASVHNAETGGYNTTAEQDEIVRGPNSVENVRASAHVNGSLVTPG